MGDIEVCIPGSCIPCLGQEPALDREVASPLLEQIPGWILAEDGGSIRREVRCKNYVQVMAILNAIMPIAEREGHHPDFSLTKWRNLVVTMTTHASKGLTMNDFVMAKLINEVFETVLAP